MRTWQLQVALDSADDRPLYQQISRQIVAAILDGRLSGGSALPGSRTLAMELTVHRNTILAAYDELFAEGWVTTFPARGTFVVQDLSRVTQLVSSSHPDGHPRQSCTAPAFPVPKPVPLVRPPAYGPNQLVLSRGAPDLRLFPRADLLRAYRRVLDRSAIRELTYADPRGHLPLREVIAQMLASRRGLPGSSETIMVTSGSQMALMLVAQGLLKRGDAVAVEQLTNPGGTAALRHLGLRLVPIRVDDHGLDVDELATAAAQFGVRAVVVTPHHQFPTTTVMPSARRLMLLKVAHQYGMMVVEDDYDHEYHYEGRPVPPLACLDRHGSVVYVGTLSKVLAPGLRIGYLRADPVVISRLASVRALIDIQGDHLLEAAVTELFSSGDVGRHLRRLVRTYRHRRDVLVDAISHELGDVLTLNVPPGGMALWARVDPLVDLEEWCRRGEEEGVSFLPGRTFAVDGQDVRATRLAFTFHDEPELVRAVTRMRRALPPPRSTSSRRAGDRDPGASRGDCE